MMWIRCRSLSPVNDRFIRILIISVGLVACQTGPGEPTATLSSPSPPPTTRPTEVQATPTPEPIIIEVNLGTPPVTLDPALVAPHYESANDLVENLFIGLTTLDPDTGEVEPALAKNWEQSEDGLTWTVYLRDDVFWVNINPSTGQMERVRAVTASDVVFAITRVCRADTNAPLYDAALIIKGCSEIRQKGPTALTPEFIAQTLGARVLNDVAVEFRLTGNSTIFPTMLAMPVLRPVPADLVESAGDGWTEPDTIWTSGPFTVQPTIPKEEGYTLIANRFWPVARQGNVDVVQVGFEQPAQAYKAWQSGEIALTTLPASRVDDVSFDDDPAYRLLAQAEAAFLVFSYDTPPFEKPGVRRAFAQALDREQIIDQVVEKSGIAAIPALTISPPGMAASPRYGEVGITYDPEAARAALEEAGYRSCIGLPAITILTDETDFSLELAEQYVAMWEDVLGCRGRFTIEQRNGADVLLALREPPTDLRHQPRRPGLIALYWQANYLDAHHWLADIIGCRDFFPDAYLNQLRACIDADQWLLDAVTTPDMATRAALYAAIEDTFFGEEGEMPVIPVYFVARPLAIQSWLEAYPLHAGPLRFDRWVVSEP